MMFKKYIALATCTILTAFLFNTAFAVEKDKVPKEKQTSLGLYLTAKEANLYVKTYGDKALFVDIRDPAELQTVGMPTNVDFNVPFKRINLGKWDVKKGQFALDTNKNFASEVEAKMKTKGLTTNDTLIVICGSGKRAAKAVDFLAKNGYTKVYSVVDGYKAWQSDGLPWSREMDVTKMYGNPVVPK